MVAAAAFIAAAGLPAAAHAATIERFDLDGLADKVILQADGTLLFGDRQGGLLSRYDPATGIVTGIPMGTPQVRNATLGADGRVWFTIDARAQIGRYTFQSGLIDLIAMPANVAGSSFGGMALGLDGSLWATATDAGRILRISPTGAMSTYDLPSFDPRPEAIVQGPDGHMWFTERNARKIGRVTSSGNVTEFAVPPSLTTGPSAIARGFDGALWFATGDGFGRSATNGEMTVYPTGPQTVTGNLVAAPDGTLWLAAGTDVIQFTPPAGVARLRVFTEPASASGMLFDAAGNLYVTDASLRQFGRVAKIVRAAGSRADTTVVEFYNSTLDHYFLTANAGEAAGIDAGRAGPGWTRTGESWGAWLDGPLPGAIEVCRFYGNSLISPSGQRLGPNSHFYTFQGAECEQVKRDVGWVYEASNRFFAIPPSAGVCPAGTRPVYRTYNRRFAQNDSNHRYTTRIDVYNQMIAAGWQGEGVVMCTAPQI